MDWKKLPDGKEKYAAYLCSREWSVLKESVRERSGGMCERCTINAMDHVHHLTYARKYSERTEDLQACCRQCHAFIHGKSDFDPAKDRPVVIPWCKRNVKTFYLAGKITGTDWRDQIVTGWSEANSEAYGAAVEDGMWLRISSGAFACGVELDYCGPWWKDLLGGHGGSAGSAGPHGFGDELAELNDYSIRRSAQDRKEVSFNVHRSISNADMVFAWIDSADCYGTIFEIGLARAQRKVVVVGVEKAFKPQALEMWLALEGCYCVYGESPREAWDEFWDLVAFEDDPCMCIGTASLYGPLAEALAASAKHASGSDDCALLDALCEVQRMTKRGTVPLHAAIDAAIKEATDGQNS